MAIVLGRLLQSAPEDSTNWCSSSISEHEAQVWVEGLGHSAVLTCIHSNKTVSAFCSKVRQ